MRVRLPLPSNILPGALRLLRPWPLVVALAISLLSAVSPAPASRAASFSLAVAEELERRGLETDPSEVYRIDRPSGHLGAPCTSVRSVVRAHRPAEPSDIYLVRGLLSPEGRLLRITGIHPLSDTSAVDERQLVVSAERAAWTVGGAGKTFSVHTVDLRGARPPAGPEWTARTRWQWRITNLQETGQTSGIGRRSFRLEPVADKVALGFSARSLHIQADDRSVTVPTEGPGAVEGRQHVAEQHHGPTRPGNLVTWSVDRVRAMPWFGSDRMQTLKAVAFAVLDHVERVKGTVSGDDGSAEVSREIGELLSSGPTPYTDADSGWPPAPMAPILRPSIEGEGQWRSLEEDPFIRKNAHVPAPFVFSFLRVDPERKYTQVFITLWDPRQVELNTMSGTREPKSATGETGPGLVPRDPETIGRLVAAFNGGFQAMHGEYGMMSNGVVYLPPKPYGATVARLVDGSTGFGTWPDDDAIPENIVSFRQNMTPLIMAGQHNPYHRQWWGGVPPGWDDTSKTVRTALCLTREDFVAYFYGSRVDVDHIARAMQHARCDYGIHLDMNPGHTGLEFYHVAREGELPQPQKLDAEWQAEGPVPHAKGWRFLARRMIRYMALMQFPRYIHRESRDFFYLTLRPLLPGPHLVPRVSDPERGEGEWTVSGLPQHGWPHALAVTSLRPDPARRETKVWILRIDPKFVRPAGLGPPSPTVLAFRPSSPASATCSVWWTEKGFELASKSPSAAAQNIASGYCDNAFRQSSRPAAMLGIDAEGMLVYAEVATAPDAREDPKMLARLLGEMGCPSPVLLAEPLGIALGGDRDLGGHPAPASRADQRLCRAPGPRAQRIFTSTPIVDRRIWEPLQAKRVRYFRKPKHDAGDAGTEGTSTGAGKSAKGIPTGSAPPALAGSAAPAAL